MSTALVWLRRELRVHDNPPLRAALETHDVVVPVFYLDRRLLGGRHASGSRTRFLLESLRDLAGSLRRRGGGLVIRAADPRRALPELARELGADAVYFAGDVSPFAAARDLRVGGALERAGVEVNVEPGVFVVDEPAAIRSGGGGPYTVFAPFHRRWLAHPRRALDPAPRALPPLPGGLARGHVPALATLGLRSTVAHAASGGECAGRSAMSAFVAEALARYADGRNELGLDDGCSRLSPYLHLGCISALELEQRLGAGDGARAFRRQLCWRDFFAHVLASFPADARVEHQARYRGAIRWSHAHERFEAWCLGRTGFPLVDAGMRQLRREGWMHNRTRLVVGSFLTKDLGIDWRWGERWFMEMLIDGDEASNNGNWQWIASVGVDPAPAFRRILSPARQQQRFDPDGRYVRRYLPELRRVPDRYLAQPDAMPREVQVEARCVIGRDYPAPIVDHGAARIAALARLRVTDPEPRA